MLEVSYSEKPGGPTDQADPAALQTEGLVASAYSTLRELARCYLRRERSDHTLQPTALVHEAFLQLSSAEQFQWQDRHHFIGFAARTMRQILVRHAKRRTALKRGRPRSRKTLDESHLPEEPRERSLLLLDQALDDLAGFDARASRVVELRFFAGLTNLEVAELLGVAEITVRRDWSAARSWLNRYLTED